MALSSSQQIQFAYEKLTDENISRVILVGEAGVGKTWMAKMLTDHAINARDFDLAIWVYPYPGTDVKNIHDIIMHELSPLVTEELEGEDIVDSEKKTKENYEKKILEKLKGQDVLFVFDGVEHHSDIMSNLDEVKTTYRLNSCKFIIATTETPTRAPSFMTVIEVGHLSKVESVSSLNDMLYQPDFDVEEMMSLFINETKILPADVTILAKVLNHLSRSDPGLNKLKMEMEELPCLAGRNYSTLQLLYRGYDLLPRNVILDLCWRGNSFLHHRLVHYSELITYWMLEAFLGDFDCIEDAYQKGHSILLELLDCGLIKELGNGYVTTNEVDLPLYQVDHCKFVGAISLGLGSVYGHGFGRLGESNGILKTLFSENNKSEKISSLLIDANHLHRDVPDDLFMFQDNLEVLAFFDPTFEYLPLSLNKMQNLRLLVLRGCSYLKGIDESLKSLNSASTLLLKNLTILEISGPSSLKSLPDALFDYMPAVQSLNLSLLDIDSLPPSICNLRELVLLILRDCWSLKGLRSLKKHEKLRVLDLSGATSFSHFEDKSFSSNKQLQTINLSYSQIKHLPLLRDLEKLNHLLLRGCEQLKWLPQISALTSLQTLDISGSTRFKEFHDQSLERLVDLKQVNLSKTAVKKLPFDTVNPHHLFLSGCTQLAKLTCIKSMKELRLLDLSKCSSLVEIDESYFHQLTCLQELNLSDTKVNNIRTLSELVDLRRLVLSNCPLNELVGVESLESLELLDLSGLTGLQKLNSLELLSNLKELDLSQTQISILPKFSDSNKLNRLILKDCTSLRSIKSLKVLPNLVELNLSGCSELADLEDDLFESKLDLLLLDLSGTKVRELSSLSNLPKLKYLSLKNCKELKDISNLGVLDQLQELNLSGTATSEVPVENFPNLQSLHLQDCLNLEGFHFEMNKLLDSSEDNFPCNISSLSQLGFLELPLLDTMEGGKSPQHEQEEKKWRIACWLNRPLCKTLQLSTSSKQFLQLLDKNHILMKRLFDEFHLSIFPVKPEATNGDDYKCENELALREFFIRKVFEFIQTGQAPEEKKHGSLEICGFHYIPEALGSIIQAAKNVFMISLSFLRCLTDLGAQEFDSMEICWLEDCPNLETVLPVDKGKSVAAAEHATEDRRNLTGNNGDDIPSVSDFMRISGTVVQKHNFGHLKCLHLEKCPNLSCISGSSQLLASLEVLQIKDCHELKTLFEHEAELPKLRKLELWELPKLEKISCKMPLLNTLDIGECHQLLNIPPLTQIEKLEVLRVRFCDRLQYVSEDTVILPKLSILNLWDLPELVNIGLHFQESLVPTIRGCPKLLLRQ